MIIPSWALFCGDYPMISCVFPRLAWMCIPDSIWFTTYNPHATGGKIWLLPTDPNWEAPLSASTRWHTYHHYDGVAQGDRRKSGGRL